MSGDGAANMFISHAHLDSGLAAALKNAVETLFDKRVSVKYSSEPGDIPTGVDWFREIGEWVKGSQVTVVLVTPRFVADPAWLLWETGAVYGSALADASPKDAPRVRPLRYRVDLSTLPAPLRAANFQMTIGDSVEEMRAFFGGLANSFEGVNAFEAGARLEGVLASYVQEVTRLLDEPEAAPAIRKHDPDTLEKVIGLTVAALRTFYPEAEVNGRYFYAAVEAGRDVLVRDQDVYVETIEMPDEFGLSRIDVERDGDTIVIAQSFVKRTPLYRVLESDLTERYAAEIRESISPDQGWVLACPVLVRDAKPLGVICLYGTKPPARDEADERRLRTVAARLSEVVSRMLTRAED
jgi:hypothetical protein